MLRRIGAVGMLWNRASSVWLGLDDLRRPSARTPSALEEQGAILPVTVEGLRDCFYRLRQDEPLLREAMKEPDLPPRCELIAPLDNLIWDRRLLLALFDFDYTWEIYTPEAKRKYGYYVLPLLYGERFIGRVESVYDKKTQRLTVKNIWYEQRVKPDRAIRRRYGCLARFRFTAAY